MDSDKMEGIAFPRHLRCGYFVPSAGNGNRYAGLSRSVNAFVLLGTEFYAASSPAGGRKNVPWGVGSWDGPIAPLACPSQAWVWILSRMRVATRMASRAPSPLTPGRLPLS